MPTCGLDYPHASVWCDACWEDAQRVREGRIQAAYLTEWKRANDYKEWELENAGRPRPQPVYYPPQSPPPTPRITYGQRGGMSVEPQ